MADKDESIQYTPEELAEIERITSLLPGSDRAPSAPVQSAPSFSYSEEQDGGEDLFEPYEGDAGDSIPGEDEEVEDISGMIRELPEEESSFDDAAFETTETAESSDDAFALPSGGTDFSATEEPFEMEIPSFEAEAPSDEDISIPETPVSAEGLSTGDQLDLLTSGEPASVDAQDIPPDLFNEETFAAHAESAPARDEEPAFEPFAAESFEEEAPAPDISLGGGTDAGLPDLSDLSIGESNDIPEASVDDIPDIDMGSFGEMPGAVSIDETPDAAPPSMFERESPLENMDSFSSEPVIDEPEIPRELADELPDIPSISAIDDVVAHEPIPDIPEPAPSFETYTEPAQEYHTPSSGGADISDAELKKLKHAFMLFPPALLRVVKDVILNDRLSAVDTRTLVDMIIGGRNENDIRRFLEDRLHTKIAMDEETPGRRRVISSRGEYSSGESRERQKRLFRRTRIGIVAAVIVGVGIGLSYQFVYKPWRAKTLIAEGVSLILKKAEIGDQMKNFKQAEDLFKKVNDDYVENYLPGYHRYARAYFQKKQYELSINKLNQAYKIAPADVDTLNGLGYFYKKVPEKNYDELARPNLKNWYYSKAPPAVERIRNKFDVAADFYLKAKNQDPKNITALVGIGDVYFEQGEYLKARQYYESILKIDANSVAGYSGLINLYIERDDFPDLLTIFVELREKSMFSDLPSPLLGKFAEYLIGKAATEKNNIRVDFGIQSERIKDSGDNPFPAVRVILEALHKRDPEYPPLYLHYAKLSMAQKNLNLVKGYLEKAIGHAEDRGQKYFGALSLLGEYYYRVKDPVKSYKYLQEAMIAASFPADFSEEEFYKETESTGRTRAVMGNIFYYFFDKITARFGNNTDEGNLEESAPDAETERMLNYDIAMKKYEEAVKDGYSSSELRYNLGRVYYLKGLYENAVNQWLNNYEDFTSTPELMFALGNAFYHINNPEAAKAEFQKIIALKEYEAEKVTAVNATRDDHIKLFSSLSAAYNNLGAVYLLKGGDTRSSVCFWKSIDYAHRIGHESEFARVNLARVVRKKGDTRMPVLDENIPFSVNVYRADMRDRVEMK
jgi:tetratricopeptide (TPR) repeat protein